MSCLPYFNRDNLLLKIDAAKIAIRKAYEAENGRIFLSFSGGKDSTVLKHIIQSMYPDVKIVFSNTTNELSEVLRFVKQFPEVITVAPDITFTQFVEKYGFPLISKEVSQKVYELKHTQSKKLRYGRLNGDAKGNGKLPEKWRYMAEQPFDISSKCCQVLKKDPLEKWAKQHGLKPIIALMADESMLRHQLALYGDDDGKKIYPFLRTGWTEDDIWAYADLHGIRFAECYYNRISDSGEMIKARDRTGCEYCGNGIHLETKNRFERSKLAAPKRYTKMMAVKNNGVSFAEAIEIAKNPQKPIIDLYGVSYKGLSHYREREERRYDMTSTVKLKCCAKCESKNVSSAPVSYLGSFYDTPHPQTGEKRMVNVEWFAHDCTECGASTLSSDLHMFDMEFGVTNRLIDYIVGALDKKSSVEILNETGISMDALYKILTENKDVKKRLEELHNMAFAA